MCGEEKIHAINNILLEWWRESGRQLPWRKNRSLYGTVLSECMLQQTRVSVAIPYFLRWMERFPSFTATAEAPEEEILLLWSGLGYYSRARNFQKLCQKIVKMEQFPETPREWQQLPGIGPYSAAAIASIGQNYDAIALDGNVLRILIRLHADWLPRETFRDKNLAAKNLQLLIEVMKIPGRCGAIGEALMDFGTEICTPRGPKCNSCPIEKFCSLKKLNLSAATIPHFSKATRPPVHVHRLWCRGIGGIWLVRSQRSRLRDFYELPVLSEKFLSLPVIHTFRRTICGICYVEHVHDFDGSAALSPFFPTETDENAQIIAVEDLNKIPISGPHRQCIGKILAEKEK